MGEHLTAEQLARTGWKFHFNNDTIRGRRNVRIYFALAYKSLKRMKDKLLRRNNKLNNWTTIY